jgi:hypothetical protein
VTSVRERNHADHGRRQFSVLCWRGWCDYDFKVADIAALVTAVSGIEWQLPAHLKPSECPAPDTCQCVHHDDRAQSARNPETENPR